MLLYSTQATTGPGYTAFGLVWRDISGAATPFVISAIVGGAIAIRCATAAIWPLIVSITAAGAVWGTASWAVWFAVVNWYQATVLSRVPFQKPLAVPATALLTIAVIFAAINLRMAAYGLLRKSLEMKRIAVRLTQTPMTRLRECDVFH